MTGFATKWNSKEVRSWILTGSCCAAVVMVLRHLHGSRLDAFAGLLFLALAVAPSIRRSRLPAAFVLVALAMLTMPLQSVLEKRGGAAGVVTALDWLGWILPVLALVATIQARDRSADIKGAA